MSASTKTIGIAIVVAALGLSPGVAAGNPSSPEPAELAQTSRHWRLVRSESFDRPLRVTSDTGWFANQDEAGTAYDVDIYDNDGEFFRTFGGEAFEQHLSELNLYRRSYAFGRGGWLTAELAARDHDGDGQPDQIPTFERTKARRLGSVGTFTIPNPNSAAVIRSTQPLPSEYRIEVRLRSIDFGGQRDGEWDYAGKVNGYTPEGCKTNFPWSGSPTWEYGRAECDWVDVTTDSNGYYFLSIMDYAAPAPHNNVFVHQRRKVVMDGYHRYRYTGNGLRYCDPNTGTLQPYEWGSGNGVNMLFMTPERRYGASPGTQYLMHSECGTTYGGGVVSQVDLVPERMPGLSYTFAIERRDGQYILEVSGYFRHVGWATYRYSQPFDDGQHPIYHYNQSAAEYDGRHNTDWTYTAGDRTVVDKDIWPAGSAYPDYFMMGIPHMNFYEGSAQIDDVRLFVPKR